MANRLLTWICVSLWPCSSVTYTPCFGSVLLPLSTLFLSLSLSCSFRFAIQRILCVQCSPTQLEMNFYSPFSLTFHSHTSVMLLSFINNMPFPLMLYTSTFLVFILNEEIWLNQYMSSGLLKRHNQPHQSVTARHCQTPSVVMWIALE